MEAAGEMLQHAFSLLGLSYQYHHFQERSERERNRKENLKKITSSFMRDVSACNPGATSVILTSGHDREFAR